MPAFFRFFFLAGRLQRRYFPRYWILFKHPRKQEVLA
jgi:hypothetical protein